MHTSDGPAGAVEAWFSDPRSGVSAHYLVGLDGSVTQFVEEEDTARHAGGGAAELAVRFPDADPNRHSIGIEFEDGGDPLGVERPAAQYRAGARLLGGIAERWGIPLDRAHVLGHRELNPAKECPGNLDIDLLLSDAERPLLVCLLPARNAEADLPGWLESVDGLADSVIALDDGSTDRTATLLAESGLVAKVLQNPERQGYEGWDDAANRRRLLDAAAELDPRWILWLDADERIGADDARALREFLERDALPGCAYGLQLHRSWTDPEATTGFTWVYRLFSFEPGMRLPVRQLHFNPVPEQIPRSMWLRTTLRIRHLDSPERLAARLAKYEAADPERTLERRPSRLLDVPETPPLPWRPRDPAQSVLLLPGAGQGSGGQTLSESTVFPRGPTRPSPDTPGSSDLDDVAERPMLVCLLPARNAEEDLPGWLNSVQDLADAVVALDDGSTDGTAQILTGSPLVVKFLQNPQREGYEGWDDAANRQRLLDAAVELNPQWVLWLDADERIDAEDGRALREFLEREAVPGRAYGMRRVPDDRGRGSLRRGEPLGLQAVLSRQRHERLPRRRLHLVPVPAAIPRSELASDHVPHQAPRRAHGGEEAGPLRQVRAGGPRARVPGGLRRPAARGGPAAAVGGAARRACRLSPIRSAAARVRTWTWPRWTRTRPLLSAVVISRDDEDRIERAVRSVVEQECPVPFEVIVVVSGTDRTAQIVRECFPQVRLVGPAAAGAARRGAQRRARRRPRRVRLVSRAPTSSCPPAASRPGSGRTSRATRWSRAPRSTALDTRAGWASYFLDHSSVAARPSLGASSPDRRLTARTCASSSSRPAASPRTCAPARTPWSTASSAAAASAPTAPGPPPGPRSRCETPAG